MTLGNSPQPLTRRQLRELAREHEPAGAEPVGTEPVGTEAASAEETSIGDTVEPTDAPAAAEATAAPAETVPVKAAPTEAAPAKSEPHHSRHTSAAPAPLPIPEAPAVVDAGRTLTRRELRALQAASSASAADAVSDQEPVAPTPVSAPRSAPADDQARTDAPDAVSSLHPPIGHWSVDREDDSHIETIGRRDDATFDDLVGRGVGAGGMPTTTNALILPSIPRQGPGGPITSTGEIMITGSIDLPRSLGATGQHPNLFDSSEMDRMLDQLDEGGHHNDVAPVSASRAVSTHTSTRGVMTPPRKRGASLPTVLAITAAVLAIGVLSLFVVGYAFNIY